MRHFTKEEIEFVTKQLINEVPKSTFIRSVLHTSNKVFDRMCKEIGIIYPNFKKMKFRNNPFEDVTNPDVQYWLGWLATDGYISNHNRSICCLSVSEKDIDLLHQYNNFLGGNMTIRKNIHHNKFPIVSIAFKNKNVVDYLCKLGFNSNKTFNFIPKFNITWDYIRGCFEGDGYFRESGHYEISMISACKPHLEIIKQFIESYNISVHMTNKQYNNTVIWCIGIYKKKDIDKFIGYLYDSAHYFLKRKYDKARNIRNNIWKSLKFGELAEGIPS